VSLLMAAAWIVDIAGRARQTVAGSRPPVLVTLPVRIVPVKCHENGRESDHAPPAQITHGPHSRSDRQPEREQPIDQHAANGDCRVDTHRREPCNQRRLERAESPRRRSDRCDGRCCEAARYTAMTSIIDTDCPNAFMASASVSAFVIVTITDPPSN